MKLFRALAVVLVLLLGAPLVATASGESTSPQVVVIDVRTRDEWNAGHLQGAIHIPYEVIGGEIGRVVADKTTKIDLYCRSGRRSGIGLEALKQLGYDNVTNLGSLENAATILGRPIVK